jgi:hypothetical protein
VSRTPSWLRACVSVASSDENSAPIAGHNEESLRACTVTLSVSRPSVPNKHQFIPMPPPPRPSRPRAAGVRRSQERVGTGRESGVPRVSLWTCAHRLARTSLDGRPFGPLWFVVLIDHESAGHGVFEGVYSSTGNRETKGNELKIGAVSTVCANSSRARCAIYSRDTAIRIYSVSRLSRKNQFVKISSWTKVMGCAEYFCRPF